MEGEKVEKKGFLAKSKTFQKLKSIKHIEIILAVVVVAIILLIYFSTFSNNSTNESSTYVVTDMTEYASMLESKLEKVLAQIDGVGNVSVMVTLATGPEYVYATSNEEKVNTNTSGTTTTTSTTSSTEPIVVSNDALVVKEILPTVGGVIVVAGGAGDTKVKLEILKAIQAILDVPQANIEVLVGK